MCFIYRVNNNGEKTSEEKIILSWTEALMLPVSILKVVVLGLLLDLQIDTQKELLKKLINVVLK